MHFRKVILTETGRSYFEKKSKQIKYLNIKSRQNKQFPACPGGMISIHPLSLLNPDRIPVIIILHDTAR